MFLNYYLSNSCIPHRLKKKKKEVLKGMIFKLQTLCCSNKMLVKAVA